MCASKLDLALYRGKFGAAYRDCDGFELVFQRKAQETKQLQQKWGGQDEGARVRDLWEADRACDEQVEGGRGGNYSRAATSCGEHSARER